MELIYPPRCQTYYPFSDYQYKVTEPKIDGNRYLFYLGEDVDPYQNQLLNCLLSKAKDKNTKKFSDRTLNVPHLTERYYTGLNQTVLDGEIFLQSFYITQDIMNRSEPRISHEKQRYYGNPEFIAFDIPFLKGQDLRHLPLFERRKYLEEAKYLIGNPYIKIINQWEGDPLIHYFNEINKNNEGVVVKDIRFGYGSEWFKLKKRFDISAFITSIAGETVSISVWEADKPVEIGEVRLKIENTKSNIGKVLDIYAQDLTPNRRLRFPIFHRFRPDLNDYDCMLEKILSDMKSQKLFDRFEKPKPINPNKRNKKVRVR